MAKYQNLRGKLIMLDGPDYVGKTTQLKLAEEELTKSGLEVYSTRYNGGTPLGEALRNVMFGDYERPPRSDLYINLAQQYALTEILRKQQAANKVVLVDRSPLSIIAYQVYGSGLEDKKGFEAADEIINLHKPHLIVCYQASNQILANRRIINTHDVDYFEQKPTDYFDRVVSGYNEGSHRYKNIVKNVDADGSVGKVHQITMSVLENLE